MKHELQDVYTCDNHYCNEVTWKGRQFQGIGSAQVASTLPEGWAFLVRGDDSRESHWVFCSLVCLVGWAELQ